MAMQGVASIFAAALLLGVFASIPTTVQSIGVCYGTNGNNLPSPSDVVKLYQSNGINAMRIYKADHNILQPLSNTNIGLIVDIDDFSSLASDPSAATTWVQNNIKAFPGVSFRYIAVGNEVTGAGTQNIVPAMQNVYKALSAAGISNVKVSTAVNFDVVANSYPPSHGVFASSYMTDVVQFLAKTGAPLLANVYPYIAYIDNPSIHLNYALFQPGTVVQDGSLSYHNLFDAMVDALYFALEKAGGPNVGLVVSESGWPSAGGKAATVSNAQTYNQNLINHVGQGTPKKPGALENYIFAMFNEDLKKGAETERNFGLFYPNQQPVYPIRF